MEKPIVRLVGEDGNVFAIIGKVSNALKMVGERDKASEFRSKAFNAESYDEVLQMVFEYVDVR